MTAKLHDALETLLTSELFQEEMENANYHSATQFLEELRNEWRPDTPDA